MNWRGETFYSRNRVRQLKDNARLAEFVNGPGTRKWILVEHNRLTALRQAMGTKMRLRVVESRNNKFALAVAEPRPPNDAEPAPNGQPEKTPTQFGAPP
jgi:hypothetical protein